MCGEIKYDGKIVVENPSMQHITSLLNHAQNLVEGGNLRYQSLANLRSELFDEEISALRYHRVCRQGVLKLKRSAAASSDDYMNHRSTQLNVLPLKNQLQSLMQWPLFRA